MAHIFELAASLSPPTLYKDGVLQSSYSAPSQFPKTEVFSGFNRPSRIEGDIHDLEVTGHIPDDIDGTFFRIQPDHRFPPRYESDIHFNGDGNVTAIRIEKGRAHFKQRYVHTDRYEAESGEGKALFGKYRNPYTDNEAVKGVIRTAANTNVFFWRGMLLATKGKEAETLDLVTLSSGSLLTLGNLRGWSSFCHGTRDVEDDWAVRFRGTSAESDYDCTPEV